MSPQAERSQSEPRTTISDWLAVNGLARERVLRYLAMIAPVEVSPLKGATLPSHLGMPVKEAWELCANAMRAAFPDLAVAINWIEAETPKCLQPKSAKHPKPFTYDLGFGILPFVSLHYQGRASDLLAMAHEFGHAVQIVASWASEEGQMPPVARECCAFIAELAIVRHSDVRFPQLVARHSADDALYFGKARVLLENALRDEQIPYQYDWNYPLARRIAVELTQKGEAGRVCALYRSGQNGGHQLSSMMEAIGIGGATA